MRIKIKEKKLFKKLIKRTFGLELKEIDSFCTDSREIKKNDIFLPIKGKNLDSHKFIPDVINKKAAVIFSEFDFHDKNIIRVKSTKETLKKLSSEWIKFFDKPIIAITGSNGKTTTKELLKKTFNYNHNTNHTIGNYNSSIGLAVNLFNFSLDADVSILEMGANNPNEIQYLCEIAKPNYSLITNIQNAHIGNFDSIEELIKTKISIFKNTDNNGFIFENVDDINISSNCQGFKNKIRFGFNNKDVDYFGKIIDNDKNSFLINEKKIFNPKLNLIMAKNMLATYSVASTYGINHETIVKEFESFDFLQGRGKQIYKNGYLIVDDTYNANFESFKMGISAFMNIECKGNKILIIGDMKELGDKNHEYHYQLGKYINNEKPEVVFSLGNSIKTTIKQINNNYTLSRHFNEFQDLVKELKNIIIKNDMIYLKASRTMKFENIINKI